MEKEKEKEKGDVKRRIEMGIWGVKVVMMCVGIICTLSILPNAAMDLFLCSWLWLRNNSSICFSPPYIYILVNIIILIVAASYQNHDSPDMQVDLSKTSQLEVTPSKHTKNRVKTHKRRSKADAAKEEVHNETMDATWKAITRGGKAQVLKKSGTFHLERQVLVSQTNVGPQLRKSDTFKESSSSSSASTSRNMNTSRRREPSISQEELNRRVEAFIKKVNNDIRLQRQQSHDRYLDMVNRSL